MATVSEIDKKIEQLKAQRKIALAKEKAQDRKERTRRLIKIGAIVEKYTDEITSLEEWEKYIQKYAGYIKKTQTNAVPAAEADSETDESPNPEVQELISQALSR